MQHIREPAAGVQAGGILKGKLTHNGEASGDQHRPFVTAGIARERPVADDNERPILIKKVKKVTAGGHHGGAWKVAYADFTTAMMAFFMLLWLLNVSDSETLAGLAEYFSPSAAAVPGNSGAGGVLGGTSLASEGSQSSGAVALDIPSTPPTSRNRDTEYGRDTGQEGEDRSELESKINQRENLMFEQAADQIRQAIQESPQLAQHNDQIILEQTPDGLRIQIIDKDQRPMFRSGTAQPYGYARRLIEAIGGTVERLPNRVAVLGHTDATPLTGRSGCDNWELSADRANAARRILRSSGVSVDRFAEVVGKADTDPLFPDGPYRAENRRVTILVMREAPVVPSQVRDR